MTKIFNPTEVYGATCIGNETVLTECLIDQNYCQNSTNQPFISCTSGTESTFIDISEVAVDINMSTMTHVTIYINEFIFLVNSHSEVVHTYHTNSFSSEMSLATKIEITTSIPAGSLHYY